MHCKFSERNYETCLNIELMSSRSIFQPSPDRESMLGFDTAIFSRNPWFWRLWSSRWPLAFLIPPLRGVEIEPSLFDELQHNLDSSDFPRFKANVFIQYKRPDYLSTKVASEYTAWGRPYFRYYIDQGQQGVMEQSENIFSNGALTVYACPAFWQHSELLDFARNRRIVENSNFVKPSHLTGHRKYTFVSGGTSGKAFSEPEDIPKVNLGEEIDKLKNITPEEKNSQFVKSLSDKISQIVEKSDEPFKTNFNNTLKYFGRYEKYDNGFANSISKIHCFLFMTDLSWLIVY